MKPRTGVFCISINEARETTDLEMPDLRNTFVIKVSWIESHGFFFYLLFRRESRNDLYYNDNICILYSFHYDHASNWILSVSETYQVGREYIYIFDK